MLLHARISLHGYLVKRRTYLEVSQRIELLLHYCWGGRLVLCDGILNASYLIPQSLIPDKRLLL